MSERPELRDAVYRAIDAERDRQDAKWGAVHDAEHDIPEWTLILRQYLNRADEDWMAGNDGVPAYRQIIKAAAVAVAALEAQGRVLPIPNEPDLDSAPAFYSAKAEAPGGDMKTAPHGTLFIGGRMNGVHPEVLPADQVVYELDIPMPHLGPSVSDIIRDGARDPSEVVHVPIYTELYRKCEMPDGSVAFVIEEQIEARGGVPFTEET